MADHQAIPWRQIHIGQTVWAPFGQHGWRPAIVESLGRNRDDATVVNLRFESGRGGTGKRQVAQLCPRKAGLNGKDRPDLPDKSRAIS